MKLLQILIASLFGVTLAACSDSGSKDSSPKIPENAQVFSVNSVNNLSDVDSKAYDIAFSAMDPTYMAQGDSACATVSGDNMDMTAQSGTSNVTFTDCNDGTTTLNGNMQVKWSFSGDEVAGQGSVSVTGNLEFVSADDTVTVSGISTKVTVKYDASGGKATFAMAFTMDSANNGGFAVTTPVPITVEFGSVLDTTNYDFTAGEIVLWGGDDTRLKITVADGNIYLDEGTGKFDAVSTPSSSSAATAAMMPVPVFLR